MEKTVFENTYVRFEYIDGILKGTYKDDKITLDTAKKIVQKRLEFTENKILPIMITEVGLKQIDREARTFLGSEEAAIGLSASALISTSALTRHLANFFLKITARKGKLPARVFSNELEAIQWLKTFN